MPNTIKQKLDVAAASVGAGFKAAGNGIKNGASNVAHGVVKAAEVLGDAKQQRQVAAKVNNGVDGIYTFIGTALTSANTTMETKGEAALAAPITGLSKMNIAHVPVTGSSAQKAKATVRNGLANYHTFVAKAGEGYSRSMGQAAHALTSALLSPIRFVAKLLQMEVAGAMIQNSIALAVGFAVRGIVLAATQATHAVPYALGIAALGAAAVGIALGGKALVATIGVTAAILGAVYLVDKIFTGGVILALRKKVNALAGQQAQPASATPTLASKAKAAAAKLAHAATAPVRVVSRHPKKAALGFTTAGLAAGAYFYGVPTVVTESFSNLARYFGFAPSLEQVAATEATTMVTRMAKAGHDVSNGVFEQVKAVLLNPKGSIPASMQVANIVTTAPAA